MAYTPGFYIPDALPPPPGGGDDIEIDPVALEQLKSVLRLSAEDLESGRFGDIDLDESAFGGCPSGQELGAEHRTAHAIIADTIQGVVTDLWGYRDGVEQFVAGMGTADDTAAADLQTQQAAVEVLAASAESNHGESQYHNSQVNHLPPDSGRDGGRDSGGDSGGGAGDGPGVTEGSD